MGQSRGCTLSPPGHIQVETIEGLNSDRPGTADLVVEQNVYDSLGNGCLMIPNIYSLIMVVAFKSSWYFYILFGVIEIILTLLIVWYAWTWPKEARNR